MRRQSHRGFTLLELLVVMVIIGLLAAFVGPRYFAQLGKSHVKAARAQIASFEQALDQFRLDVGRYPNNEEGLQALVSPVAAASGWAGPYLKKDLPLDPWGRGYNYQQPGDRSEIDIFSFGKDGRSGGAGEDADVGNW